MGKVIELPVITTLDISAERVIRGAAEADLEEVIIIGVDKDGDFYLAFSRADAGTIIFHLEKAKLRLLGVCDDDLPEDVA